jgi:hypothetical protein
MFNIVTNEHWMLVQRIPINYSEENRGKESKKMNEIQLLSHLSYNPSKSITTPSVNYHNVTRAGRILLSITNGR